MFALAIIAVTAALAGYLLGSLPFGFLVARSRGVNSAADSACNCPMTRR